MRISGRENIPAKGAFVLACNHQSYLDPILCGAFLKRRMTFLARESLFSNWFFGGAISSVGVTPLKTGGVDLATVKKIISKLNEGRGVCLFPEGTRTYDGRITAFKPGLGLLCRRGGAAIVPVVIDGAFECWPRHKKMFSPGPISVCYGKAISAEKAKKLGDKKLAQVVTDTLRQMQNDCRARQGKQPYQY